jgi:regulatory protein
MPDAYDEGLRLLGRRALTRREVVERLTQRGHAAEEVKDAVTRLEEEAAIDDDALARHWIGTQALARGRGRDRALAELQARGVDPEVASSAWSAAVDDGAVDDALLLARAVRRRLGPAPGRAERGRLARVYNALLSEGFAREQVASALAPYGFEGMDG